jgi:hypothetical protein
MSWFTSDPSDPTQQLIYVDGAPFDGHPDAVRPIIRTLKSPTFAIHAIGHAFLGAAVAACLPASISVGVLAVFCFSLPAYNVLAQRDLANERRQHYPSLRNVLIDKTGRAQTNPNALASVENYYRNEIAEMDRTFKGVTILGAVALTGFGLLVGAPLLGAPLWMAAAIGVPAAAVCATPYALRLGWALYAQRQLHRAERPWTVTADPPPLRRRATRTASRQLAVASAPARARMLAATR